MKYTLALCVLLAAWIVLGLMDLRCAKEPRVGPRVPSYSWSEMSEIFAREQELDEELKRIQLYRKNQAVIEEQLRGERLTLRKAATMLDSQLRAHYPLLREMLEDRYPSISHEERAALLLLEHLENDGGTPYGIERLCTEMRTWSKVDPTLFRQPRMLK
jgi:hypothetical protein